MTRSTGKIEQLQARIEELEAELSDCLAKEKNYRSLVDSSQDILYRTDSSGLITYISPSVYRLSGYTVEEAVGMNMAAEVYSDPKERDIFLNTLAREGKVENFIASLKRKDGSIWWASTNAHFHKDASGTVIGVEGITRDITNQLETDLKLRFLFDINPDLICLADSKLFTFKKVNPAFIDTLGYAEEELLRFNFLDLVHPGDRQTNISIIDTLGNGGDGILTFRNRMTCKNGSSRWLSWHVLPLPDTELVYGIGRDITDEIKAEEALQESERQFRNIIESSPMGVHLYELTSDDRLIFAGANPAADRMLGMDNSRFIGMAIEEAFPPLTETEIPDAYRAVCRQGTIWNTEQVNYDDQRIIGAYEVHAFQTSPGKMAAFFLNITERKKAEEEKRTLQHQLQQAQKMEAIGTLAGGIAHDFNNILMGIQGRISLALLDAPPGSKLFDHLSGSEEYIKAATDLTRQLLGFARGGKYEVKTIDINKLLRSSADMFGPTKKDVKIHFRLQQDVWNIEGDLQQLHQVLLNLYVNAWQAMPNGGELFLQSANVELNSHYMVPGLDLASGYYVKISVQDTGTGMDEQTLEKVFEPFFTTKDKSRGTGLGLASAYGIIKNHLGAILVSSQPGRGATFDIYLPATRKPLDTQSEPVRNSELMFGSETILIVDDESMVLDVGTQMLKELGYTIFTASSGQEAVSFYKNRYREIDLVILDMIMPGLDGRETFDLLREINHSARVLLSSGYSLEGRPSEIMTKGCGGFIQKPFDLKRLSIKVREVLDLNCDETDSFTSS